MVSEKKLSIIEATLYWFKLEIGKSRCKNKFIAYYHFNDFSSLALVPSSAPKSISGFQTCLAPTREPYATT